MLHTCQCHNMFPSQTCCTPPSKQVTTLISISQCDTQTTCQRTTASAYMQQLGGSCAWAAAHRALLLHCKHAMSHQPTLHKANKPCSAYQHCLLPPGAWPMTHLGTLGVGGWERKQVSPPPHESRNCAFMNICDLCIS